MTALDRWTARRFFYLNGVYAVILVLLLIARRAEWWAVHRIEDPIGGLIPIGVPWFGALGALLISTYGVFDHNAHWDTKWNYWHAARPFVGAVLGVVAFLVFVGLINATGSDAQIKTAADKPTTGAVYLVLAFVVGFREQTFRLLIQRAVDILFGPGTTEGTPFSVVLASNPTTLAGLVVGTATTIDVTLANAGTTAVYTNPASDAHPGLSATVSQGTATVAVSGLSAVVIATDAAEHATVDVTPATAGTIKVEIEANGSFGRRTITLTGSAVPP